jgi:hypothetical protein
VPEFVFYSSPIELCTRTNEELSGENLLDHICLIDTREFLIEPLILVSEFLVIYAELVQQRRLEVTHMDWVFHNVVRKVVVSPWTTPPFTPPPAIQMLKQRGWWSRP